MPFSDSPFGPLPSNLPQARLLEIPQARNAPQQMPMPSEAPRAPAMPEAGPTDFQTIVSGIGNLLKQSRDDIDKKEREKTAKDFAAQLAALRASQTQTQAKPDQASGQPADLNTYEKALSKFESGDNPNAQNSSGATGLYQFMPATWGWIMKEAPDLGLTEEGIKDPAQQTKAMRYYTRKSAQILEPILGRKPTGGELYLLHLLGHSGGPNVLSAIDKPITETISSGAYRSNPFLKQYTTGRDLIAGLNKTFGG